MDVGERSDLRVVTVDSLTQMSYREEREEIHTYGATLDHLRATALSQDDSRALMKRLMSGA